MQTVFPAERLTISAMQSSEKILRSCVHCGFCTATCPTYLLLGDELDSPRGRIYLIKEMLESGKPATPDVVKHVDRCLSCLSCMTTCPSGVNYMHLVDHARAYIEETYRRPWHDRLVRRVLALVLPYPSRFRLALRLARLARPIRSLIGRLPDLGPRFEAMLSLAPASLPAPAVSGRRVFPAGAARRQRVAILAGCAQPVLRPDINEAAIRLLNRVGIEVVSSAGEGCCGALVHHMGREEAGLSFAKANIDAWMREIEGDGLDAILVTSSGCGTTIKDYGFMLRDDAAYAEKAKRISALAKDISEYAGGLDLVAARKSDLVVAYHSACSLQHGQQIKDGPKMLLRQLGLTVKDIPEGHICCGSAGVYNIMQPVIANQLRGRKIANIGKTRPDLIVAGNLGCMTQIARGTGIPMLHTVEMLDWMTGGPLPPALETRVSGSPSV